MSDFIVVDNISKNFGDLTALKDVSFSVKQGEIFGLVGESGAGKSVIMHALRGTSDYRPDKGNIYFNVYWCKNCSRVEPIVGDAKCSKCNQEMEKKKIDFWNEKNDEIVRALKSRISIMLQRTFSLYGDKSTLQNIIEAFDDDISREEKTERAKELLEKVDMTHRITHIARNLSGGEKQRVILARQLARDPILLLADEPTGTLDPKSAEIVHNVLKEKSKEENLTILIASHWPAVIREMADSGIWVKQGEIKKEGGPKEITEEFIGKDVFKEKKSDFERDILHVRDAKKYFYSVNRGVVKAVDKVSLDIKETEIFGLVGWSGSGKTTLARMIAGITSLEEGEIEIRIGEDWVDMTERGPKGRGRATPHIAILHQEHNLHSYSTVFENLSTCIGTDLPEEFIRMKARKTLKGLGFDEQRISEIFETYPTNLSAGENQRVALAQNLIKEPRLNILDEPAGTLDPITKKRVANSIKSARDNLGETFMIISHDKDFILSTCDRASLMSNGKMKHSGDPKDVVEKLMEEREKQK